MSSRPFIRMAASQRRLAILFRCSFTIAPPAYLKANTVLIDLHETLHMLLSFFRPWPAEYRPARFAEHNRLAEYLGGEEGWTSKVTIERKLMKYTQPFPR
jgi:hypothetical protein